MEPVKINGWNIILWIWILNLNFSFSANAQTFDLGFSVVEESGLTKVFPTGVESSGPCPNNFAVAGPDTLICSGQPVALYAGGGVSYQWSNGGPASSTWTVTPMQTTNYIVTVTDNMGCIDTAHVLIRIDSTAGPEFTNGYQNNCGQMYQLPNVSGTCSNLFTWGRPNKALPSVEDCRPISVIEQFSRPELQAVINTTNPFNYSATLSFQVFPTATFPVGVTTITYTATNEIGQTSSCSFSVQVMDTQAPHLTCPPNQTLYSTCPSAKIPNYTNLVLVTDNCSYNVSLTQIPTAGSTLGSIMGPNPQAGNTFTLTATGNDGTNSATCSFTVTLQNGTAPIPTEAALPTIIDSCGTLNIYAPTALDPCNSTADTIYGTPSTPVGTFLNTSPPSYQLNPGNYVITWVYNDGNGNISTQPQNISVLTDNFPPVAICVPNFSVNLDSITEKIGIAPGQINDRSFDPNQCGSLTFSVNPDTLSCANAGSNPTVVTLTVTDAKGNTATCNVMVSVEDNLPPIGPAADQNINVNVTPSECFATVTYEYPGLFFYNPDECTPPVTLSEGPAIVNGIVDSNFLNTLPSFDPFAGRMNLIFGAAATLQFPVGQTIIPYTWADQVGNKTTEYITVNVLDNTPPSISCPANVTLTSGVPLAVSGISPTNLSDNCGAPSLNWVSAGATLFSGSGNASGSTFNPGISTLTYASTDPGGNTATCSFTINIQATGNPYIVLKIDSLALPCESTDTFLIPLRLFNFINVAGLQFTLSWDTATLDYIHIEQIHPAFPGIGFDTITFLSQGKLAFSWVNPGGNTLPDSTILFAVDFVRNSGSNTLVTISNAPNAIAAIDWLGNDLSVLTTPGLIQPIDNILPTITCPANVTVQTSGPTPVNDIALLLISDNCVPPDTGWSVSGATIANFPNDSDASGSIFNPGISTVQYQVTDSGGNTATCSFTIDIEFPISSLPTVFIRDTAVPPCDHFCIGVNVLNFDSLAGLQFSMSWDTAYLKFDTFTNFNPALSLTANNFNNTQTINGYLGFVWVTDDLFAGTSIADSTSMFEVCFYTIDKGNISTPISFGPFLNQIRAFTNTTTPTTEIQLLTNNGLVSLTPETVPPVITCPPNVTVQASNGITATVNGLEPLVLTDNCSSAPNLVYQLSGATAGQSQGPANGVYNAGLTTVLYTATDGSGNTATCSFTVFVDAGIPLVLKIQPDTSYKQVGDHFAVDIAVEHFADIIGIQCNIVWDTSIIKFDSIGNVYPGLGLTPSMFYNFSTTPAGELRFFGGNQNGWPDIPDNDTFFRLHFTAVDTGITPLLFTGTIEAADSSFNIVPVVIINGAAVIGECPPIDAMLSGGGSVCPGTSLDLDYSLTGGTPPYTLSYSDGSSTMTIMSADNTGMLSVLPITTTNYQLQSVFDGNGCLANITGTEVVVAVLAPPNASISAADTVLSCQNPQITLTASGGGTYNWLNGLGANPTVQAFTSGLYQVEVTATNGCRDTASITLTTDGNLPNAAAISIDTLTCTDTLATLQGSSSTPNALFSWTGPGMFTSNQQNPVVSAPGTYTLTVTSLNGCTATATASVSENKAKPAAAIIPDPIPAVITCATSSVVLTASGGNTFQWLNGSGSTNSLSVSSGGDYAVEVKGANGCTDTATINVLENLTPPDVSITPFPSGQLTCQDTVITLIAAGGGTYMWSNALGNTAMVSIHQPGAYMVTVTDPANGCTAQGSISIGQIADSLSVSLSAWPSDTLNCAVQTIQLIASGGTTYSWSGDLPTLDTVTISLAGTYSVTATNAAGCSGTGVIDIGLDTLSPTVSITATPSDILPCNGFDITLTALGGEFYEWSDGLGTTPFIMINAEKTYSVTATNANGCTASTAIVITLQDTIKTKQSVIICEGDQYEICDLFYSEPGEYVINCYTFNGCDSVIYLSLSLLKDSLTTPAADTLQFPGVLDELPIDISVIDTFFTKGNWEITVIEQAREGNAVPITGTILLYSLRHTGFIGRDSFQYKICNKECPEFCTTSWVYLDIWDAMPNAFFPESTETSNQTFDPLDWYLNLYQPPAPPEQASLTVFNRWGEIVYRADPYLSPGWDGRSSSGKPMPQGTYYYLLQMTWSETVTIRGAVHLLH